MLIGYSCKVIVFSISFLAILGAGHLFGQARTPGETGKVGVPILLYHRFGPVAADSMTVTTPVFASHLEYLEAHGCRVIPLRRLVDYYLGKAPPPLSNTVVITVDDGHRSVYTEMRSLVERYRIPVTLFIYPSAIGKASYAMTWDQLRELKKTGLFDIQSHTFWHPNFHRDRRRLSPSEYEKFVDGQLQKSKAVIERELGTTVDMLAWAFGIYDDYLIKRAGAAGYVAAFTIERRTATAADHVMTLPRYLLTNAYRGKNFTQIWDRDTVKKTVRGGPR